MYWEPRPERRDHCCDGYGDGLRHRSCSRSWPQARSAPLGGGAPARDSAAAITQQSSAPGLALSHQLLAPAKRWQECTPSARHSQDRRTAPKQRQDTLLSRPRPLPSGPLRRDHLLPRHRTSSATSPSLPQLPPARRAVVRGLRFVSPEQCVHDARPRLADSWISAALA